MSEDRASAIKKLGELISGIHIAMLTTAGHDGALHSRPMATQELEFDGDLWFMTKGGSLKTEEIRDDSHVNVSYVEPKENRYVSVSGRAQLIQDAVKAKELWHPLHKAWFPDGPEDPDLLLVKVEVESAQYWDAPSNRLVLLAGMAKAAATGKEYDPGENETLKL